MRWVALVQNLPEQQDGCGLILELYCLPRLLLHLLRNDSVFDTAADWYCDQANGDTDITHPGLHLLTEVARRCASAETGRQRWRHPELAHKTMVNSTDESPDARPSLVA